MGNNIFLDGVAGCGKSTLLTKLTNYGFNTKVGDYSLDAEKFKIFQNKNSIPYIQMLYSSYLLSRINPDEKNIIDRTPVANIVYEIIHLHYKEFCHAIRTKSKEELFNVLKNIDEKVDQIISTISENRRNFNVIIFLSRDPEKTLNVMIERDSKYDILEIEYVMIQNYIFEKLANGLEIKKMYCDPYTTVQDVIVAIKMNFPTNLDMGNGDYKILEQTRILSLEGEETLGTVGLDYNFVDEIDCNANMNFVIVPYYFNL